MLIRFKFVYKPKAFRPNAMAVLVTPSFYELTCAHIFDTFQCCTSSTWPDKARSLKEEGEFAIRLGSTPRYTKPMGRMLKVDQLHPTKPHSSISSIELFNLVRQLKSISPDGSGQNLEKIRQKRGRSCSCSHMPPPPPPEMARARFDDDDQYYVGGRCMQASKVFCSGLCISLPTVQVHVQGQWHMQQFVDSAHVVN